MKDIQESIRVKIDILSHLDVKSVLSKTKNNEEFKKTYTTILDELKNTLVLFNLALELIEPFIEKTD